EPRRHAVARRVADQERQAAVRQRADVVIVAAHLLRRPVRMGEAVAGDGRHLARQEARLEVARHFELVAELDPVDQLQGEQQAEAEDAGDEPEGREVELDRALADVESEVGAREDRREEREGEEGAPGRGELVGEPEEGQAGAVDQAMEAAAARLAFLVAAGQDVVRLRRVALEQPAQLAGAHARGVFAQKTVGLVGETPDPLLARLPSRSRHAGDSYVSARFGLRRLRQPAPGYLALAGPRPPPARSDRAGEGRRSGGEGA